MDDRLLGLPLETALARLRAQGITPRVVETRAPGDRRPAGGTLRVIRVRENELTVAAFQDGAPKKND